MKDKSKGRPRELPRVLAISIQTISIFLNNKMNDNENHNLSKGPRNYARNRQDQGQT